MEVGGGVTPTEVKGGPIVLTPEDFKTSDEVETSTQSTESESKNVEEQYEEPKTTIESYPAELSTEATTEKAEDNQNKETEKVAEKLDLNDISRVQIFAPAWFSETTPNEEDSSKLEKYSITKKDIDGEKLKTIKSFVNIFFNLDSRNFVDSSQIDETLKKLTEIYNGTDISSEFKLKVDSKLVCVVSEPIIYGEDGSNNVYISLKRYIPTKAKEEKYGRYLIRFNFNGNKVFSYEILEEIYELPVLSDTSDIPKDREFPTNTLELGLRSRRILNENTSECNFKGPNVDDSVSNRIIKYIKNYYSAVRGFNYKMYYDESQIELTASEIAKFGYNIDEARDLVKSRLRRKMYESNSIGITSKDHMFYSSEDSSIIVVYALVVIYDADNNQITSKYSARVDEIKIRINPESVYGFEIENAKVKSFIV